MLYCDYDTYSAMGGTMSAEQYGLWGPRASRKIDELTLGRAEGHAADLKTELEDACSHARSSAFSNCRVTVFAVVRVKFCHVPRVCRYPAFSKLSSAGEVFTFGGSSPMAW